MQFIIFPLLILAEFLTTPKILLFYDQVEYLKIISENGFWQVLGMGHFPIHPFFLSFFWLTSRIILPNYTAFILGAISAFLVYKISQKVFKGQKYFWLPALIFLLFPGVWLVNTNLMIQSMLLTIYLFSIYFFLEKKSIAFLISVFLMMGIHVDAVYWIPTIFLLPVIFKKEIEIRKKDFRKFAKMAFLGVALSVLFYAYIYLFIRKDFGGSTEQLLTYSSFGILRIVRNIWVGFINSFGSITPALLAFLLFKNLRSKHEWLAWIIFAICISVGGAYWEGDLMMRRIVFAGFILSFAIYKYLDKKAIYFLLFLLPITGLNAALYYKNLSDMPLSAMQKRIDILPKNQVLLSSHYYYPFIKYEGDILWFESGDTDKIESYLKDGKRVFMTKESVTAPYLLVVGNNYHITSLNKVGNSESRVLFEKYKIDPVGSSFEIKPPPGGKVSEDAGQPVVFYGKSFWERLSRMRVNYGDLGIWLWSMATGHKDAEGFTYKDVTGTWVWP